MRGVIQRVSRAGVVVDGIQISSIGPGLLVFLGIEKGDKGQAAEYLAEKTAGLRIFEDDQEKMNLSVLDCAAEILVVSQFTLLADCRKGKRPGFSAAELPEIAEPLCDYYVAQLRQRGIPVETGQFRADMKVDLVNDGPVTILLDSHRTF